jgi:hypothetical protein
MTELDCRRPIRIPGNSCCLGDAIYSGVELELVPIGVHGMARHRSAVSLLGQVRSLLPSRPSHPEAELDIFSPPARFYLEMGEFVEVAGVTCKSPEAVPWLQEAAFSVLRRTSVTANGRPVVLCHTPTDYSDYSSGGEGPAHSAGSHANLLCRRSFDSDEFAMLASVLYPLNTVFGPGGITWSNRTPRFTCDPRADHVTRLVAGRAHGDSPKPFILRRDEPLAESPFERIQIVAFGGPRSPVSSWLRAELLTWALRAVHHRDKPPFYVLEPLKTLRAAPDARVRIKRRRLHAVTKTQLAIETVCWLADSARKHAADASAVRRVERIRELGCTAAEASAAPLGESPVFPTDISIKRFLFDRIAQGHGFTNLAELCRAWSAKPADGNAKSTMDAVVVNDIFFSSCDANHSSYEHAARAGVFLRPEFAHAIDIHNLARLPEGVCRRAQIRAAMLAAGDIEYCNWNSLITTDGVSTTLPNPWSCLS